MFHNFLGKVQATSGQEHDLLQFRGIDQATLDSCMVPLKQPTMGIPVHRNVLYLHCHQHTKRMGSWKDRKLQDVFQSITLPQRPDRSYWKAHKDHAISPIPKALVNKHGLFYKASKSVTTGYLKRRHNDVLVVMAKCLMLSYWLIIHTP